MGILGHGHGLMESALLNHTRTRGANVARMRDFPPYYWTLLNKCSNIRGPGDQTQCPWRRRWRERGSRGRGRWGYPAPPSTTGRVGTAPPPAAWTTRRTWKRKSRPMAWCATPPSTTMVGRTRWTSPCLWSPPTRTPSLSNSGRVSPSSRTSRIFYSTASKSSCRGQCQVPGSRGGLGDEKWLHLLLSNFFFFNLDRFVFSTELDTYQFDS